MTPSLASLRKWAWIATEREGESGWHPDTMAQVFIKMDEIKAPFNMLSIESVYPYRFVVELAVAFLVRHPNYEDARELCSRVKSELWQLLEYVESNGFSAAEKKFVKVNIAICTRHIGLLETIPPPSPV